MNSIMQAMAEPLGPKQLGCGISRGVEAAVHATWIYVHNLQPQHLILELDCRNAFNCLHRDMMLMTVREVVPELFPLGHLLFSLIIHGMLQQLKSEFGVFHLDDGTLGGNLEEVLRDLRIVERKLLVTSIVKLLTRNTN